MSQSLTYRPEIDGLRAIAVVAVMIFHLDSTWLRGGFLGVDVFFVISGFLITSIIYTDLKEKRFSLVHFWLRRIQRIFPALLVMVAVVAIVGNFVLISPERTDLVLQSFGAVASFSNILLWRTTGGYWASSSENIALLHTWSLSLEEQFYIFFPVFLLMLHKYAKKRLSLIVFVVAVVSISLSIYGTPYYRSASFYLLPTRMWELLIGSLLSLFHLSHPNALEKTPRLSFLALLGVCLVAASFIFIDNDERFPGPYPLIPCVGTALILMFGQSERISYRFLTLGFLRYIGKISYSLYLWHWPVIVFSRYLSPHENTLALVILTLGLSSLSYHFIESPFRRGFAGSLKLLAAIPVLISLCLLPIYFNPASPGVPAGLADLESEQARTRAWEYESTDSIRSGEGGIVIGDVSQSSLIALVGDSHARVLSPPFAAFAKATDNPALIMATSGIGITTVSYPSRPDASRINSLRFEKLQTLTPSITFVAGMWSSITLANHRKLLRERLQMLSDISDKVVVLSQVPMFSLPDTYKGAFRKYLLAMGRTHSSFQAEPFEGVAKANATLQSFITELAIPNIVYLDIYSDLITKSGSILFNRDGLLLYSDYHHLNDRGSRYVFERSIEPMLSQP